MVVEFLQSKGPCFDVRSPLEYNQGYIPGAINLPLFTDDERAAVGTVYKKKGQKEAIELGVKLVGPKLSALLEEAKLHLNGSIQARVYCFRGGMRSAFVSWFLNFVGFQTSTLKGGYKVFRRFVFTRFEENFQFVILGGFTGSGKTEILEDLKNQGEQVIDLEGLALHRGSIFGLVPGSFQPTSEQFENEIAIRLTEFDVKKCIWIEDESRQIGGCGIPDHLFKTMQKSPLLFIESPVEDRIEHIVEHYGSYPKEYLITCVEKIAKRLGREKVQIICQHIQEKELAAAVCIILQYYDKTYSYAMGKRTGAKTFISKGLFYDSIRHSRLYSVFEKSTNCLACLP